MCVYYISETLDVTHDSLTMTNELDFYLVKQENDVEYTKTRFNRVLLNMTHRWTSFEADSWTTLRRRFSATKIVTECIDLNVKF